MSENEHVDDFVFGDFRVVSTAHGNYEGNVEQNECRPDTIR